MSKRRSRSPKFNAFLDRYDFDITKVDGNRVIRLFSDKSGVDFDIDPQDNLHFIGIFDPRENSGEDVRYVVQYLSSELYARVTAVSDLLLQWEVYVDILEENYKRLLEGDFS